MIPTLTYQWPLTSDIYFHISVAQVYSHYGFTLINPLYNPPVGTPIGYPPFFSMFLLFLHSLLKINYIQVARLVQPLFAMSVVLSVSYVAKKFYGDIAGISAGFLILSSYLFGRIITPLPETLALILVPLVVYLYYRSVMDKKYKYAIISSLLFSVVILTHQATTVLLSLIITFITLILGILKRKTRFFTSYAMFLSLPILTGVLAFIAVLLIDPSFLDKIYALTVYTKYYVWLPSTEPISYLKYVAYLLIPLIFAIIGGILALKRRENKDLLMVIWILVIFLMSKSYWFGINVYSIRLLVHLLLPLSILGGMGLSYLYLDFKKREFPSESIRSIFLITIFVISSLFAIVTVTDPQFPQIPKYASTYGLVANPQIAPPTNSDLDMGKWFNEYGNKNKSVLITNIYSGWILLSLTGQPIATINSTSNAWFLDGRKTTPQLTTQLKNTNIGYLVYDKRLTFQSQNPSLDIVRYHNNIYILRDTNGKIIPSSLVIVRWDYFIYYSTDIHGIIPTYAHIVHENDNYIICEITQDNQF